MAVSGRFFVALAGVCAVALVGLEIYTRIPDELTPPVLNVAADATRLTLVFHGSGGSDDMLMSRLAAASAQVAGGASTAAAVNWSPASDNRLRAAANARVVGAAVGEQVARLEQLTELQLVGHSSGAFVLDALCDAVRARRGDDIWIESIFLDPFGIDGFLNWGHGARRHGYCADFALNVLNTDDQAPATNSLLRNAYTLDVTAVAERPAAEQTNLHYWPVQYLAEQLEAGRLARERRTHERLPRGVVTTDPGLLFAGP